MPFNPKDPEIPPGLTDAIRSFPARRNVENCGTGFAVSALDLYADCPVCGTRIKLRAFSSGEDVEDVIDAVLEWMSTPGASEIARQRQAAIALDRDEE